MEIWSDGEEYKWRTEVSIAFSPMFRLSVKKRLTKEGESRSSSKVKGKLNYRCPQCFMRDIDMSYDEEKHEYYCIRCCFHGDEEKEKKWNAMIKLKYGYIANRITSLNDDNKPIRRYHYKKGEF